MANRLTAIFFLFTLTSTYCSRLFIIADFELNRQYIAENYCINKNRPWMHCNGHCYLMKKLNEAQQKQNKDQEMVQKTFSLEATLQTLQTIDLPNRPLSINLPAQYTAQLFSVFLTPPFHPPWCA